MPFCPTRGCEGERQPRHYVCRRCWLAIPVEQRRRLRLNDRQTLGRLSALYRQLAAGRAPADVEVPA